MKETVLKFLRKHPDQRFNTRQIAHHLKLTSGDYKELRQQLKALISAGKIIIHPEERYSCRDENKILKGSIKIHADGYGFFLPESRNKTDVFVPMRYMNYAMNGDTVLVESVRNKRDGRYEGRIIQILERANVVAVGQVVKKGKQFYVSSLQGSTNLDIYVPKKKLKKAVDGDLVAVNIIQYPGPGIMAIGEVSHVIGEEFNDESLTDAVLIKYQIFRKFDKKVQNELQKLPDDVQEVDDRKRFDLTDLPIITIDGITAKDFDDAVCVVKKGKSIVLYVCIADVSEYVLSGSALDQEAYKRGTSTYLPDECVPMLPEKLSNGLCSLVPYEFRNTLTAEIHYNENYELTRAHYYKSLIRSQKRATYEEVEAFFDGTGGEDLDPQVQKSLKLAKKLAEKLLKLSKKRGTLGFDLPEAEIVYDVHGKIQTVQKSQRFFSHKLIEMLMIAANVAVAQYFSVNQIPLLYRVHEQPDPFKVQNFLQIVANLGLHQYLKGFHPGDFFEAIKGHKMESFMQSVFLRSLKQAVYDAENAGHYGLSLKDYCHFTSPIRRYPDLIVHRQLKTLLEQTDDGVLSLKKSDLSKKLKNRKLKPLYRFQDLHMIGMRSSKRERDSMEAEREISGIRKALFIKDFVHEKFFGRLTRISKYGVAVELDPYFVEGFLPIKNLLDDYYIFDDKRMCLKGRRTRKLYRMGDRIWVTVVDVKVETADITLGLAELKSKTKIVRKKKKGKKRRKG